MTDINSNINLNIDTDDAIANIKRLQAQISVFHQQMLRSGSAANEQISRNLQSNLMKNIDATGKFTASIKTIQDETESFTQSLEKNQMSMGQYFRYAGGATKTFGRLFSKEFNTIQKVAEQRVKDLQTQYIKLGRDANGALKAIQIKPLALDMDNYATKAAVAAQKQQLLNQLLKQGSTNLLNFGKNTQWAGRQLMVGFTIPLAMAGTAAAKAYMDIEKASIKFRRVYGDLNTGASEATRMAQEVKQLAMEFTKYGVAVKDTMEMAATAAATGSTGAELLAQIQQAGRLAVLGQVEQQQALETTISLTNAFQIATQDLAGSINFLNAVENQTVTSIEDLTIAIPKAAPVIKQLGGDVKDLSFFLTAMKEGGINASEGANALKSGLASIINPTQKASDFLAGFGINLTGIVEANKGDVKGTVVEIAKAFDTLDPLNRARAIEQLFGKFQFARISTLFQNVIQEGSQAQTVLNLAKATSEELAVLSERELKKVEDSPVFKFQKAVEQIQAKLAPVGEAFLKAITPVVEQVGKILDGFNNMGDGAKQFAVIATTVLAGIGPIALMTFGLIANGVANLIKMFAGIKNFFNKTGSGTAELGDTTEYMTQKQLEAQAVAAALDETHAKLVQSFTLEAEAINKLVAEYEKAIAAQSKYNAGTKPTTGGTQPSGGTPAAPAPTGPATPITQAARPAQLAKVKFTEFEGGSKAHLTKPFESGSGIREQAILDAGLAEFAKKYDDKIKVVSNLVMELPQTLNKKLDQGGATIDEFSKAADARTGKLAVSARLGGADVNDEEVKQSLAQLEQEIKDRTVELASGTESQKVTDDLLAQATREVIDKYTILEGKIAETAQALDAASRQVGQVRVGMKAEDVRAGIQAGDLTQRADGHVFAGNVEVARISQSEKNAGKIRPASAIKTPGGYSVGKQFLSEPAEVLAEEAKQVGQDTGQGVIDGAKETLDTNSPSRKMYDIGKDGAQGLINGARDGFLKPPPGSGIIPPGSQAGGVLPPPPMTGSIPGVAAPAYTAPKQGKMASLFGKAKDVAGKAASKVGDVAKQAGSSLYQAADKAFSEHMTNVLEEEDRAREIRQAKFSGLLEEARLNDAEFAAADKRRSELIRIAQENNGLNEQQSKEYDEALAVIRKKKELISAEMDANNMQEASNFVAEGGQKQSYKGLNKAGRKDYWKSAGNKIGKGAMGATAIAGVASMIPGPVGEAASSALPLLGTLSTLSGLITGPVTAAFVGVAAVLAAVIGVALKLNEVFSQARDKSMALTEATGASTKAIKGLAEFAGKVSAGEFMNKVRQDRRKITYSAPGKTTFGESFVQSESGKALVEQYKTLMKTAGAKEVTRDMSSQLSTAIVSGALSAQQAKSIAANLAYELGNATIGLKVRAEIVELLGPDGNKFEKNPVEVTAKLTDKSVKNMEDSFGMMNKNIASNVLTNTEVGRTGTAVVGTLGATAIGAAIGTAILPGVGTLVGAVAGALVGGYASFKALEEATATAGKLSGVAVADMATMLQQQNELSDALDAYYIKKIREAEVEGKITEAKRLQVEYDIEKNKQNKVLADGTQRMMTLLSQASEKGSFVAGTESALNTKFKDDANAQLYLEPIKTAMNSVGLNEEQKVLLNISMISDSMAPGEVAGLLSMMQTDSSIKQMTFDILTNFPGKTGAEAIGIAQMFDNKDLTKELMLKVSKAKNVSEVDDLVALALEIQSYGGVLEQTVEVMVDYAIKNEKASKEITRIQDALGAQEVTKVKQVFEIMPELEMNKNAFNEQYFNTLKNTEQKEKYVTTIGVILNTVDNVTTNEDFKKWWQESGYKYGAIEDKSSVFWKNVYAEAIAQKVTESAVDTSVGAAANKPAGGGGTKETSFLDAFVKRIRDVLKYTQQLTEGWVKSKKAIEDFAKTGMLVFDGLEMKLKRAGATDELTGAILGLSKEDYDKYRSRLLDAKGNLTDFAKTLVKVTNQLAFGDAIVENDKIVLQAKLMSQAFSGAKNGIQQFVDKGIISAVDAYEILSDATLASAFAADKEGKSRKALVTSYMMAKKAQWLMLSADQKRQKYVEMYNANLEVIAIEEEKINKKYDERNEALDKIQAANEAIAQQNQAQLSLSEALSRGDLSGAVRAAKEMESLSATQAVEARRAAMEQARKDELSKIEVDINGVLMNRKDIEEQIRIANEATTLAKAAQLDNEIKIGKQAEENRSAVLAWAASKENPVNKKDFMNNLSGQKGQQQGNQQTNNTNTKTTAQIAAEAEAKNSAFRGAVSAFLPAGPVKDAILGANGESTTPVVPGVAGSVMAGNEVGSVNNPITVPGVIGGQQVGPKNPNKIIVPAGKYFKMPKGVNVYSVNSVAGGYEIAFGMQPTTYRYDSVTDKKWWTNKNGALGITLKADEKILRTEKPQQYLETSKSKPVVFPSDAIGFSSGGMVPKYMSIGGPAVGTDTVPAMLTPGEFVVSQPAVEDFGVSNLKAINNGTYGGNSVYNYSVNVNAGSNASADDIARAVMNKINEVDARRVRGNNF